MKRGHEPGSEIDARGLTKKAARNPLILGATMLLINFGYKIFQPFIPLYLRSLNADIPAIGLVFTGIAVATYASALPGGVLADRFGRKAVMVAGNAVGFGFLLALLAVTTWQAALVVIFVFVCVSFLAQPAYAASLAESTKAINKGGVFGTFFAFSFVGVAIGTLVGGYLPNPGHFVFNIALAALVGIVAAVVQALLMKETVPRNAEQSSKRSMFSVRFSRYTWIVLLTTLTYYCASGMWSTLYAVFATERLGFSVSTFGVMVAVGYVAAAIGAFVARRLSKRIGIRAMTMLSIMAAWPVVLPWIYTGNQAASIALFAVMYFLFAIDNVGLEVLMVDSAATDEKGKVVGLITTIAGLGSVAAPYIGSLLWVSVSPSFPLVALVVVGVASALPLFLLPKLAAEGNRT